MTVHQAQPAAFVHWLDIIPGRHWLVLGPGSEGVIEAVLTTTQPSGLTAVDAAQAYVDELRRRFSNPRARFLQAPLDNLPFEAGSFDVAISQVASPQVVAQMRRVLWAAGTVALWSGELAPEELERLLRQGGLHAIKSAALTEADHRLSVARATR